MFFPQRDKVFQDGPLTEGHWQTRFRFDESVAAVFDDMALRSIPLYRESLDAISHWARKCVRPGSTVFDLGCSTGSSLVAAMSRLEPGFCSFVGIDTSPEMLQRARTKVAVLFPRHRATFLCEDLALIDFPNAGAVILNYTLQFVPKDDRLALLTRVYESLPPGGLLFISDKLALKGAETAPFMTGLYHSFKEEQGYSRLEIERKRAALEEVLVPFTLTEEIKSISDAGFSDCEVVLKWNQFASFAAVKS